MARVVEANETFPWGCADHSRSDPSRASDLIGSSVMNVYSKAKTVLGGDCLGLYRFRNQAALDHSLSSNRIVWHHSKGEKRFLRLICACTGAKQVCFICAEHEDKHIKEFGIPVSRESIVRPA